MQSFQRPKFPDSWEQTGRNLGPSAGYWAARLCSGQPAQDGAPTPDVGRALHGTAGRDTAVILASQLVVPR